MAFVARRRDRPSEVPCETRKYVRSGELAGKTEHVVCDLPYYDVTIERLEIGFASPTAILLYIYPYKKNGELDSPLGYIDEGGSVHYEGFYPSGVHSHLCDILTEMLYNTTENLYKYSLNRKLRFANGLKIRFYNNTTFPNYASLEALLSILPLTGTP